MGGRRFFGGETQLAQEDHAHLLDALTAIPCAALSYQEWCDMGMALHESGFSWQDWDAWSQTDTRRYKSGECERKWASFGNGSERVTSGTIIHMAERYGWVQPTGASGPQQMFGWDDVGYAVSAGPTGPDASEAASIPVMDADDGSAWDPAGMLYDYLDLLFDDDDIVGYVCESWQREGEDKWLPTKGVYTRTAGDIKSDLMQYRHHGGHECMSMTLGEWEPEAGAWIRFNPLDGQGVDNKNVTKYRYALVESDVLDIDRQLPAIRDLRLPCVAVVSSAGKSVHAIVRVDAQNIDEYRKRVRWLYDYCDRHGFVVDRQNKNASRLSRMPGITRAGRRQMLIATNIGEESWDAWRAWAEESEDDLPDEESLFDLLQDPPPLASELIAGVLRQGHKMLLAGPSKAGKSFLLMQLAMAVASGSMWLGKQCSMGKVLYINLEIDRASVVHRFQEIADDPIWHDVYGWEQNITVWNLRGNATTLDKLTPSILRRGKGKGYALVIIDPIYKVITGDENSASEMALFCNHFDVICHGLGCSVAYCHHHSKGEQGAKKAMDRASGSGVFSRDPDAQLDMTPIDVGEKRRQELGSTTCWRIAYTLREFEAPKPTDLYFKYPVHVADHTGALAKYQLEGENPYARQQERRDEQRRKKVEKERKEKEDAVRVAMEACKESNIMPTAANVADYIAEHIGGIAKITTVKETHVKDWCNPSRSEWTPFRLETVMGVPNVVVYNDPKQ